MSEIDQQFIEYVVKSLVGKPDAVKIDRRIDEKGVLLELTVDPEDLGRVIGKRGATAQSLRTLLRALGTKNDARYNLKIIDNGPSDYKPANSDAPVSDSSSSDSDAPADLPEAVSDGGAASKVGDEPVDNIVDDSIDDSPSNDAVVDDAASAEDETSDRLRRAREELADLDDLDV